MITFFYFLKVKFEQQQQQQQKKPIFEIHHTPSAWRRNEFGEEKMNEKIHTHTHKIRKKNSKKKNKWRTTCSSSFSSPSHLSALLFLLLPFWSSSLEHLSLSLSLLSFVFCFFFWVFFLFRSTSRCGTGGNTHGSDEPGNDGNDRRKAFIKSKKNSK